jgi:hypothetical protein
MGRQRWAERRKRPPGLAPIEEISQFAPIRIRCGFPFGDGSVCMAPASTLHATTHVDRMSDADADNFVFGQTIDEVISMDLAKAWGQLDVDRELFEGTAKAPAGSGAPAGEMRPSLYRELTGRPYPRAAARDFAAAQASIAKTLSATPAEVAEMVKKVTALYRPPTYETLKAAASERAQFTAEQAQQLLSAALGTRPHLAARVVDQLGPVLAGELARAVDGAVNGRINRYLADEKATLDRLYTDQLAKLQTDQERRGRDVNVERWTTPSRLS